MSMLPRGSSLPEASRREEGALKLPSDGEVEEVLRQTAKSLTESLLTYWPADEDDKNDACERNTSLHLGHVLLSRGFTVFAEPWYSGGPGPRHIDLLGISPDHSWFFAWESKKVYSGTITSLHNDVVRLEGFGLNKRLKLSAVGERRKRIADTCNYGIKGLGGLYWARGDSSDLLSLWRSPQPEKHSGFYADFAKKLAGLKAVWVPPVHLWDSPSGTGSYYFLAVFFRTSSAPIALE